ncbi:hypothetical protein SRABI133_04312 [Peribacillus simplex]|uniref:Uncharacterized protein n=1 Tax=Peribacillus simplex TaxID=1478 RepID=A0A9W4PK01_9BACI|nr:hypothetical protein SRABI133_04312 [Peribacillus simplex]
MLCVIGLPFNFCFKFHEECQHLSFIRDCPCSSIGAIVIKSDRKSIRGKFRKKLANSNDYVLLLKGVFT